MKNILKTNPLILANTFSVKKSLLKSRIVMLQKTSSLRLALLKFTFFIPILLLCCLTALSFKKEIHLENTPLARVVNHPNNIFIKNKKRNFVNEKNNIVDERVEKEIPKSKNLQINTTTKYEVFFNIGRFEDSQEPFYQNCANPVKVLLYEKKTDGKLVELDWKDYEPKLFTSQGRIIKDAKKGQFYVIPNKKHFTCKVSVKESSLGINADIKVDILPIPPIESSIVSGASFFYSNRMNFTNQEQISNSYFDITTSEYFKFSHPRDATFIPRDVLVIQYRGKNEKEVKRQILKDGKLFKLHKFDIKDRDIIEIRLLTYDHINALGEIITSKLSESTLNEHTFYFTIEKNNQ